MKEIVVVVRAQMNIEFKAIILMLLQLLIRWKEILDTKRIISKKLSQQIKNNRKTIYWKLQIQT